MDNDRNRQRGDDGEIEIDVMRIVRMFWSKIWVIILAGITTGIIALIATELLITPLYQSTTKLYIISRQNDSTTSLSDLQTSSQLIKDYKVLVTSYPVAEQVVNNLSLSMSPDGLIGEISCAIQSDSHVLAITVTDQDPYMAKKIVDEVANVSAKQITSVMKMEEVNVIEYGRIPGGAISPNVKKNTMLGAIAGAFLAIIVIFAKNMLDDSIKSAEDVERYLGMSTLSLIPMTTEEYNGKHGKGKRHKNGFQRKRG